MLKVGVTGLGRAFSLMIPAFAGDSRVSLVAGADPRAEARAKFAADFGGRAHETVEALCADREVDVIYVATPHGLHAQHAMMAAQAGKHVLVEKPMALTLQDCAAMIDAAKRAGVHLIVGHSHSFDAPIRRARELIASGEFGAVKMITAFNYTDFLYRPRRPEELDPVQGGGAVFNQAAHQIDIVRLLGGGRVKSVRAMTGAWDTARPVEAAFTAQLVFENGAFASLVYSGYGHFDSDEFQNWIGESGHRKQPYAKARAVLPSGAGEAAFKNARNYGGVAHQPQPAEAATHQHFGLVIVSCERGDLRPTPDGVMIYQGGTARREVLPPPKLPRGEVIDELYDAIVNGRAPLHDGAWAMATMEVCLAMLRSAHEGGEVRLQHQIATP
ncbi:MAG: Gfo/Idh/MocA family oxidoreductase [Xanthobacteraceae bacterium]